MTDSHTPLYNFCFLYPCGLALAIWIIACICYAYLYFKGRILILARHIITGVSNACLGMVLTHITFMIRTKLTKLHILPISLHSASSVCILVLLTNFGICFLQLGYLLLGHLLSGSILNHLMHSKDANLS